MNKRGRPKSLGRRYMEFIDPKIRISGCGRTKVNFAYAMLGLDIFLKEEGRYQKVFGCTIQEGMAGEKRLPRAAQAAGITDIPVHYKSFETEDEALAYAIHLQRNRRNLTDAEIVRCIEALDRRKQRGASDGFRGNQYVRPEVVMPSNDGISSGRSASAKETARVVGISPSKVERTRTVLEHAGDPVKEAVRAGEISINQAYQLTQEKWQKPQMRLLASPPPEPDPRGDHPVHRGAG